MPVAVPSETRLQSGFLCFHEVSIDLIRSLENPEAPWPPDRPGLTLDNNDALRPDACAWLCRRDRSCHQRMRRLDGGVIAGSVVYGAAVWTLRVPEARQIWILLGGRLRRRRG
jgi:hypothetical protein